MKNILKNLGPNIAIIGTQWGDEGKGKLVDAISQNFDIICRSTGGANAGHTIVTDGKKFIFHLLPSGLLHEKTIGVIGNGTVVNISDVVEEIEALEKLGLEIIPRVKLSLKAHLLFDYHKKIDAELERRKGSKKLGTTHRGIGPAYEDKIARIGIRVEDLLDKELLKEKIKNNCDFHSETLGIECNADEEFENIIKFQEKIKPILYDTQKFLNDSIAQNKKILFEGAQAHHLDIDHGTYPFVTSSSVCAGGIATGLGIAPKKISGIIGIAKAYTTRVGEGPFPSELDNERGENIRKIGVEYGATTGRPRRCGWFDAVVVKNAVEQNGIDTINLTKLDVLTGQTEIKIATKYMLNHKEIFTVPTTRKANEKLNIEYEACPGWTEDISKVRKFEDLPVNAQNYIKKIEQLIGIPVEVIGVGMDREDLIFR